MTQAFQTAFISSMRPMSASQIFADRIRDLSLPAAASSASIFARMSRLLGYKRNRIVGRLAGEVDSLTMDDRPAHPRPGLETRDRHDGVCSRAEPLRRRLKSPRRHTLPAPEQSRPVQAETGSSTHAGLDRSRVASIAHAPDPQGRRE
jgi:hypothetical protein